MSPCATVSVNIRAAAVNQTMQAFTICGLVLTEIAIAASRLGSEVSPA